MVLRVSSDKRHVRLGINQGDRQYSLHRASSIDNQSPESFGLRGNAAKESLQLAYSVRYATSVRGEEEKREREREREERKRKRKKERVPFTDRLIEAEPTI